MAEVEDLTSTIRRRRRRSNSPSSRLTEDDESEESGFERLLRQRNDPECGRVIAELETVGEGVLLKPSTLGPEAGLGLFANRPFAEGAPITEYAGQLITSDEAKQRFKNDKATHLRRHIPLRWVIDGTRLTDGTPITDAEHQMMNKGGGAFVNDPRNKNRVNAVFDFVDCKANREAIERICKRGYQPGNPADPFDPKERFSFLRATRDIEEGEEILVSYGDDYWAGQQPLSLPDNSTPPPFAKRE